MSELSGLPEDNLALNEGLRAVAEGMEPFVALSETATPAKRL